ncbi:hypothetical protein CTU88_44100, partial [Streptomyces sp. JV178]
APAVAVPQSAADSFVPDWDRFRTPASIGTEEFPAPTAPPIPRPAPAATEVTVAPPAVTPTAAAPLTAA